MTPQEFRALVQKVTGPIAGEAIDGALEKKLNAKFPAGGEVFRSLEQACRDGIAAGFMCTQGEGKRKYGRIFEPAEDLAGFSVDVVDIDDLVGNYHRHPTGEIDLVMPQTGDATFDARG
ncbi:MAG: 4-hydroxylaminobenzoate lyase, partial [Myxococcales bacterium]